LELVPHPAQRLSFRQVGRLGLDARIQHLPHPSYLVRRLASRRDERLDCLRHGGVLAELGEQPLGRLWEPLEVAAEQVRSLGRRQAAAFAVRHVDPRAAQVDRQPAQVDRVQPAADPVPGFKHEALESCVR
jgi:hypothetical protein